MSFQEREDQKMMRLFEQETGDYEYRLAVVAKWAEKRGFNMPKARTSVELLARRLQRSARAETRTDRQAGRRYRVNHSYTRIVDGKQKSFWFDIDGPAATKLKVQKALMLRREQALSDVVQIAADRDHWNHSKPASDQIEMDFDLNDEVQWRLAAPDEDDERRAS